MESEDNRIGTFVHVSDIHIGDINLADGDALLDADAETWWRAWPLFDGFLGHSHAALGDLMLFFGELRTAEQARLIITGDLTAVGSAAQFLLARTYFESAIALEAGNHFGLLAPDAYDLCIPGNHDHWPGKRAFWGAATAGLSVTFPQTPMRLQRLDLTRNRYLTFCGIDTDADVYEHFPGPSRALARGSFVTQLQLLGTQLGPPTPEEARVLLLHHSRMNPYGPLGITRASLKALERFVEDHHVAILLCGHKHVPKLDVRTTKRPRNRQILEARCGTTTQRDQPPASWKLTDARALRRFAPNSLLVHRVYERFGDGAIFWEADVFGRTETGFVSMNIGSRVEVFPPLRGNGRRPLPP